MGRVAEHFKRHKIIYAALASLVGGYNLAAIPASHKIAALEEEARGDTQRILKLRGDVRKAREDGNDRVKQALQIGAKWTQEEVRRSDKVITGLYKRTDELTAALEKAKSGRCAVLAPTKR